MTVALGDVAQADIVPGGRPGSRVTSAGDRSPDHAPTAKAR